MTPFMKILAAVALLVPGQSANASSCPTLATFFFEVVLASGSQFDKATLEKQTAAIRSDKTGCANAIARLEEAGAYSHHIGAPLTPLREYIAKNARFSVRLVGQDNQVELIQFDVDAVGALRKRPAR